MGRKKKVQQNDKFNFEDDYIIGISEPKESKKKNKTKTSKKKGGKASNKKDDRNNIATGEIDIGIDIQEEPKESKKKPKKETIKIEKKKIEVEEKKGNYRLLKILLVVCGLLLFVIFLRFSPSFNINTIIIENNSRISSEEIEEASGIEKGVNLFAINKRQAAKAIEESPYIDKAEISRKLPDTIKIVISERTEKYYVEYEEGAFAILDGQGYVLDKDVTSRDLVGLVGLDSNFEELIARREDEGNVRLSDEDLRKFDLVAKIVDTAQSNDVLQFIKTIDVSNINDVKLNMPGEGKIAYIGNCSDLITRISYLKIMLDGEKGKSGIMFLNVDFSKDRPYFRENV